MELPGVHIGNVNLNFRQSLSRRFDVRLRKRDEKALLKAGAFPNLVFFDPGEEPNEYLPDCAELYWMVPCYSSARKLLLPFAVSLSDGIRGESLVCVNGIKEGLHEPGPCIDIFDRDFPPVKLRRCKWDLRYRTVPPREEDGIQYEAYDLVERVELLLPSFKRVNRWRARRDRWSRKYRKLRFKLGIPTQKTISEILDEEMRASKTDIDIGKILRG